MSTMAFRERKEPKRVTLSVTPLIDVLFLLIIFFTLTSTFKRVGELELQLPDSTTAQAPGSDSAASVELIAKENGLLLLDGEPVAIADLSQRLRAIVEADADRHIMIKAEAGVVHGEVVNLLDLVRSAGFTGAGIGTHMASPAPAE